MIQTSLVVKHKNVIENRLIALLVQEANHFSCKISFQKDNKKINKHYGNDESCSKRGRSDYPYRRWRG